MECGRGVGVLTGGAVGGGGGVLDVAGRAPGPPWDLGGGPVSPSVIIG